MTLPLQYDANFSLTYQYIASQLFDNKKLANHLASSSYFLAITIA